MCQRILFAEHEPADHHGLDVGKMSEYPQRMAPAVRSREHEAVLAHFLNASENDLPALPQVVAYEIKGLHRTTRTTRTSRTILDLDLRSSPRLLGRLVERLEQDVGGNVGS